MLFSIEPICPTEHKKLMKFVLQNEVSKQYSTLTNFPRMNLKLVFIWTKINSSTWQLFATNNNINLEHCCFEVFDAQYDIFILQRRWNLPHS